MAQLNPTFSIGPHSWVSQQQAENALQMGVSTASPVWLVEVTQALGSAPREAATRMLVRAHDTVGTIGGGHLEWQAIRLAREAMAEHGVPFTHHFALGPALGQCCGGAVDLRFAPLTQGEVDTWPEPIGRFSVHLYGAGHVGQALVRLLATLPCKVHWLDERDSAEVAMQPLAALAQGASHGAARITPLVIDTIEAEVRHAPDDACHLVMTHSHDLDLRIVDAVLRHGRFRYLGLIGSATKKARFLRQLEAKGWDAATLARITCPIGMPGIGGKEPEVIAVAVAAQLLALG